jgi:hypothetical protein
MWGQVCAHWRMAALVVAVGLGMSVAAPSDAQNVESGVKSRGVVSSTTGAGAGAGPRRQTATVGGRDVVLVLDPDQCLLDRNHPSDSRVYELVEKGLAGQNELLLAAADCEQIGPWRNGTKPTLDDFTQVQVALTLRNRDLTGREVETVNEICSTLRKQGDAAITGPMNAVRDRFNQVSETVKINQVQFVGVVREDPEACYASLLQRVRTEHGTDKLILCVYAHVVLRGRLVYLYRYTEGDSFASMVRSTDMLRRSVQAHLDANQ